VVREGQEMVDLERTGDGGVETVEKEMGGCKVIVGKWDGSGRVRRVKGESWELACGMNTGK